MQGETEGKWRKRETHKHTQQNSKYQEEEKKEQVKKAKNTDEQGEDTESEGLEEWGREKNTPELQKEGVGTREEWISEGKYENRRRGERKRDE